MGGGGVRGFFDDRFVRNYDRCLAPLERVAFAEARNRLIRKATGLVLDLGAGTGSNFGCFVPPVRRVIGVDRDIRMLERSSDRNRSVPVYLTVADAEALPFRSGLFDTGIATLVFCTIPRPEVAPAELGRVLVPGGRALFLEHVGCSASLVGYAQDPANPLQRIVAGGCNLNRRTESMLDGAGLRIDRRSSRFAGILVEIEAISAT